MLITELQPLDLFMDINFGLVFAVGFGGIAPTRLKYEAPVGSASLLSEESSALPGSGEVSLRRFLG
jgi:hypothetical protein